MAPSSVSVPEKSAHGRFKSSLSVFNHVRWEHLVAGVAGGVTSTLVLHPLDLIKVRFQVNEGVAVASRPQYNGIMHAFGSIARQEGLRGLYQGVTPNVWGAGASWGLYFLFYNTAKAWMLEGKTGPQVLAASQHITAAAAAGVITLMFTNPLWVAKTRLCLQYDKADRQLYRGTLDCLYKIGSQEGMRGLYKGLIPGLFGVSHGVVQFVAYEELKKLYNNYRKMPLDTKFSSLEYICFAALSKVIAASSTYPYQVVRSRLQDQHRSYTGAWDVINKTWKGERLRGFFKGLSPYLLHVTPNICIVFLMYEKITHYVEEKRRAERAERAESPAPAMAMKIDLRRTVEISDVAVAPVVPRRSQTTESRPSDTEEDS